MDKLIFQKYNQLEYSGQRTEAVLKMADITNKKPTTIKNHWLQFKEFPRTVNDKQKRQILKAIENLL